jgi:hypothetical protein
VFGKGSEMEEEKGVVCKGMVAVGAGLLKWK